MRRNVSLIRIRIALSFLVILSLLLGSNIIFPKEPVQALSRGIHQTIAMYAKMLANHNLDPNATPEVPPWMEEINQYLPDILAPGTWSGDPDSYAITIGADHEDEVDHVWDYYGTAKECVTITHFWDPDNGISDTLTCLEACSGENAAWKAMLLWGMALGEYYSGDKDQAYEYLGHIVHLLGDMSVPGHAHKDCHVADDTYDDEYMNGEGLGGVLPEYLIDAERASVQSLGMVEIPDNTGLLPLYYLFYMTAQRAGRYASEDYDGNTDEYDALDLVDFGELEYVPGCDDSSFIGEYDVDMAGWGCDYTEDSVCRTCMEVMRRNSYFYAIRAVATLYKLFAETTKRQAELTLVIEQLLQLQGHGALDDPDYYVKVKIGDRWFINIGSQAGDTGWDPIDPSWAFAYDVGLNGTADVWIELYDDDDGPDCHSDIYSGPNEAEDAEERNIWLTVNLTACREGTVAIDYDLTGTCRCQMTSAGDDEDRSQIWFRILPPNSPPIADGGPDKTVNEGDVVILNGSFTDPDPEDTHTFLWHLVSSTTGQVIPDSTLESLTFVPCDNGVYTFSFTVTDNHGAWDSDEVVITVNNVPPVVSNVHISNQENAEFILPVVHTTSFEGTFTDAGTCDTHTALWAWGDGTTSDGVVTESDGSGTAAASHTYSAPGNYTITLAVTDDDGDDDSDTMTIHIADVEEALDIFNAYIQSVPDNKFKNSANQRKAAFNNMFVSLDLMLAVENYYGMILSLNSNMRTKFDGLVGGSPKDDWIKQDLAIQTELCQKVDDITAYLEYLLSLT